MDPLTTASAGAAPVVPTGTTQPASAPGTESPNVATPVTPVAPPNATPTKTANDIVLASGDELATRYGLAALADDSPPAESTVEGAPSEPSAPSADPAPVDTPAPAIITNPATALSFYDDAGELDIPANVKLAFKVDGREVRDVTIDQVVRMAQQVPNIVNQKTAELSQRNQTLEQGFQRLQSEFEQNNALYEQMLTNPALYQEAASQYQAQNSPEQRLARLQSEQQAQAEQHQQQLAQINLQQTITAASNYTATRIAPSVEALTTQYPQVDPGDVMAMFHQLTAPLLAPSPNGGVWVPPNRLGELEQTVLPQLRDWAAQKASKSTAETAALTKTANEQTRKAQTDAQLAKRQLVRPLTPLGSKVTPDTPAPPRIRTAGDAVEAALARVSTQIRQGAA